VVVIEDEQEERKSEASPLSSDRGVCAHLRRPQPRLGWAPLMSFVHPRIATNTLTAPNQQYTQHFNASATVCAQTHHDLQTRTMSRRPLHPWSRKC